MKSSQFYFFIGCFICLSACGDVNDQLISNKKPQLPDVAYDYKTLQLPISSVPGLVALNSKPNFNNIIEPSLDNGFIGGFINSSISMQQEITDKGATLGRVLFYDKNLSQNNTISCASCHNQKLAFTDGKALSPGFRGELTERNSMSIINPILQNNLFWDSRSISIMDLSLKPVQNHIEMGMERLDILEKKVTNIDYYEPLFVEAFGDGSITSDRIGSAISQFVSSITSSNSRFDKGNLNDLERKGQLVFAQKCGSCHAGTNFAADDGPGGAYGMSFESNGSGNIENLKGTSNIGLDLITNDVGFDGKFRIPTLRNIMLTAPYMHDGRFANIDQVLDHYANGIKPNKDLDVKFRDENGKVKFISLSEAEKLALKAFMAALTDNEMINNPKYSDPFTK